MSATAENQTLLSRIFKTLDEAPGDSFKKLAAVIGAGKMAEGALASESDPADFIKLLASPK